MTGRADWASPGQLGSAQGLAGLCPASPLVGRGREYIWGGLSPKTLPRKALRLLPLWEREGLALGLGGWLGVEFRDFGETKGRAVRGLLRFRGQGSREDWV